jgi:hypothetical protein
MYIFIATSTNYNTPLILAIVRARFVNLVRNLFQRRRFKCESYDVQTDDDRRTPKAHMAEGELKMAGKFDGI